MPSPKLQIEKLTNNQTKTPNGVKTFTFIAWEPPLACLAWKILRNDGCEVNNKGACLKISFTSVLKNLSFGTSANHCFPLRRDYLFTFMLCHHLLKQHYCRLLLTRHYGQRPFDKTVCDAIIANGGVKNHQKRCKTFAMTDASNTVQILVACVM